MCATMAFPICAVLGTGHGTLCVPGKHSASLAPGPEIQPLEPLPEVLFKLRESMLEEGARKRSGFVHILLQLTGFLMLPVLI